MKRITKSKIEWLYKNEFLWLVLGAMLSSDYLTSDKAYETAIEMYQETINIIPSTNMSEEEKKFVIGTLNEVIDPLKEKYETLYGSNKES